MAEELSVVMPVYNEGAAVVSVIGRLREALSGVHYRIYLVHDRPDDTTVPVAQSLRVERDDLQTVLNDVRPGVVGALKKGFASAQGEFCLVTMADGSDRAGDVPLMLRRAREGAVIVAASRYSKGGKQVGAPWFKSLLSRGAGMSLHFLAGAGTRDCTNNFKLYRTAFLREVEVESRAGFEVALELVAKALERGAKISEVPTVWEERKEGTSRFRLRKWLPHYLRWYFRALRGDGRFRI